MNNPRRKASAVLTFFLGIILLAPQSAFSWVKRYGTDGSDRGYALDLTTDGGCVVAGRTTFFEATVEDFYLLRCDENGDTLWTRMYGGELEERAHSVRETKDGGYILAGFTASYGAGGYDFYLVKTDAAGDTLWARTYGGEEKDTACCVCETSDNGYVVVGYSESFGAGKGDIYLVKLNSEGDTLWTKTYGGTDDDEGNYVLETSDGGYLITGSRTMPESGNAGLYLLKTDENGNTLWERTYGGTLGGKGYSIYPTMDGGYIVSGCTWDKEMWGDVYLLKIDAAGDTSWTNSYGGISKDRGFSVCQTTDGGYVVVGYTLSFGAGQEDVYLVRTDANGDSLWARTYGGELLDEAYGVRETADGGYVFAGRTRSFGSVRCDVWIVKTDSEGDPAIREESPITTPLVFNLHPNPFNDRTTIKYNLPEASYVTVDIYDPLGKKVSTLVDRYQITGSHCITWDGTDFCRNELSSGVYFMRFETDKLVKKSQLVMIR